MLSKIKLIDLLDHKDGLFRLANLINWDFLETAVVETVEQKTGRPKVKTRLVVGLHYLKYLENKSDEEAVETFIHNPYWQYFCGNEFFEHEYPLDASTLSRWRKKLGSEKVEKLLEETLNMAKKEMLLPAKDIEKVNVDTTVQEKNIAFPTDARLQHQVRRKLVKRAKLLGVSLRQSYERLSHKAFIWQGRYAHARQGRRAKNERKKIKNFLGRVIRDIQKKFCSTDPIMLKLLEMGTSLYNQGKDSKNKIYSLHEPHTECIAKGKSHKKYEFGCKASFVTTSKGNWILAASAHHGNPYDGHTLKSSI